MESITKERFIRTLKEKGISLFVYSDLFKFFDLSSESAAKSLLYRLKKAQIIKSLARGKFCFNFSSHTPSDFAIANFLNIPSYVSLESALSFYGIINQFPYQVTSVTLGKSKVFHFNQKKFSFTHLRSDYFTDYAQKDDFTIATPQKAIFDFVYLVYKGSRSKNNLDLLIFSKGGVTKAEFKDYLRIIVEKHGEIKFLKFCQNQKLI